MSALPQMEKIADELRNGGFRATTPVREEGSLDWSALSSDQAIAAKRQFLIGYFDKIRSGDAVLIVNIKKHGIEGYVGANTLMEAACGAALGKPVFYFNDLGNQHCRLARLIHERLGFFDVTAGTCFAVASVSPRLSWDLVVRV
jgi:hypothetical protein